MNTQNPIEQFKSTVVRIRSDRSSGSQEVLNNTVNSLKLLLSQNTGLSAKKLLEIIRRAVNSLRSVHNQFSALIHFSSSFEIFLHPFVENINTLKDAELLRKNILGFIKEYSEKWKDVNKKIAELAIKNIDFDGKTILLHSHSHTVETLFDYLKTKKIKVSIIQTEARPKMEGRLQAQYISNLGYKVTFIVDSAVSKYAAKADMAIVGCDCLFPDYFINKVGTETLAHSCLHMEIPFYILTDSRKFAFDRNIEPEKRKSSTEIWSVEPESGIIPENFYYEGVPNKFITKVITEQDVYDCEELKEAFKNNEYKAFT